jgi:hypothetical protein
MINYRGVSRCSCDMRRAIEITTHRETTPTQIHRKSEIIWSFSDTTLRHQTFKRSELKDRTTVGGDTSEFVRRILSMPLAVSSRNFQAQHSSRPARILCQSSASRGSYKSPRQIDITGQANRHKAPVAINCPLTSMFECQLEKKGLKMVVNALVIQTVFLLAMAATAAYCWIKVLFPPARLD